MQAEVSTEQEQEGKSEAREAGEGTWVHNADVGLRAAVRYFDFIFNVIRSHWTVGKREGGDENDLIKGSAVALCSNQTVGV